MWVTAALHGPNSGPIFRHQGSTVHQIKPPEEGQIAVFRCWRLKSTSVRFSPRKFRGWPQNVGT